MINILYPYFNILFKLKKIFHMFVSIYFLRSSWLGAFECLHLPNCGCQRVSLVKIASARKQRANNMTSVKRPLSPHLQVYRPQITSVLSISHRMTGIVLAAGAFLLVCWLVVAAYSPVVFEIIQAAVHNWFVRLIAIGWTLCLFYHLSNGIRHLFWDAGVGLEITQARVSGWVVVFSAIFLTALSWVGGLIT